MRSFRVVAAAAAFTGLWWLATVYGLHGGDWTALFCTGAERPPPQQLNAIPVRTFPGAGFDGQYYRYLAHDPFLTRGMSSVMEHSSLRSRRILVPLLAWAVALGRPAAIDAAFIAVTFAFVMAGVWWSAQLAALAGFAPGWGLLFLALPSTLLGLMRMTSPDIALCALTAAFAWHALSGGRRSLWVVLALAPLARETGVILLLGWCGWLLLRRQWRSALVFGAAAAPWLLWSAWVAQQTSGAYLPPQPGVLLTVRELAAAPLEHARSAPLALMARALDWIALAAAWAAALLGLAQARRLREDPCAPACLGFALLGLLLLNRSEWWRAYDHGRVLSPLLLLLASGAARDRRALSALPLAGALPRMLVLPASQLLDLAARWLR